MFLDADNELISDALAAFLRSLREQPDCAFAYIRRRWSGQHIQTAPCSEVSGVRPRRSLPGHASRTTRFGSAALSATAWTSSDARARSPQLRDDVTGLARRPVAPSPFKAGRLL